MKIREDAPGTASAPSGIDRNDEWWRRYGDLRDKPFDGSRRCGDVLPAFMELSSILVGRSDLSRGVGLAYLALLVDAGDEPGTTYTRADLAAVLARFARLRRAGDPTRRVRRYIMKDWRSGPAARAIAYVWFTASVPDHRGYPRRMAPAELYAGALIWDAIAAIPPGVPGPFFGHWGSPPPQPIADPDGSR